VSGSLTLGKKELKRFLCLTAVLVAAIFALAPITFAASPAQDCTAAGGTYVSAGPDSTCTLPGTPVGSSDNTKGGSETSGPGKSEPQSDTTTCTGVNNKPHSCP
jgi:hypothetical protein